MSETPKSRYRTCETCKGKKKTVRKTVVIGHDGKKSEASTETQCSACKGKGRIYLGNV